MRTLGARRCPRVSSLAGAGLISLSDFINPDCPRKLLITDEGQRIIGLRADCHGRRLCKFLVVLHTMRKVAAKNLYEGCIS